MPRRIYQDDKIDNIVVGDTDNKCMNLTCTVTVQGENRASPLITATESKS